MAILTIPFFKEGAAARRDAMLPCGPWPIQLMKGTTKLTRKQRKHDTAVKQVLHRTTINVPSCKKKKINVPSNCSGA